MAAQCSAYKHAIKGWLCLALLAMASSSLLPQTPNGPLPEKWLKNGHLIVPELNFSIDSPALDSHWSYQELPKLQGAKETAFIVDASAERYVLIVWEKGGDDQLNEPGNRKRMWDEMQKSLPTGWQTVGEPQVAQTNVPLSRSWNVTATIRRSDGSLVQAYQYITGGKRTYIFVDYSTETTEPPRFNRFVTSFSVLSPGDNIYTPDIGLSGLFLVLFILGFGFFAPVWWFRRTRGNHPHWQKHCGPLLPELSFCFLRAGRPSHGHRQPILPVGSEV